MTSRRIDIAYRDNRWISKRFSRCQFESLSPGILWFQSLCITTESLCIMTPLIIQNNNHDNTWILLWRPLFQLESIMSIMMSAGILFKMVTIISLLEIHYDYSLCTWKSLRPIRDALFKATLNVSALIHIRWVVISLWSSRLHWNALWPSLRESKLIMSFMILFGNIIVNGCDWNLLWLRCMLFVLIWHGFLMVWHNGNFEWLIPNSSVHGWSPRQWCMNNFVTT